MLAGLVKPPTLVLALSIAAGASCSRGAAPEPSARPAAPASVEATPAFLASHQLLHLAHRQRPRLPGLRYPARPRDHVPRSSVSLPAPERRRARGRGRAATWSRVCAWASSRPLARPGSRVPASQPSTSTRAILRAGDGEREAVFFAPFGLEANAMVMLWRHRDRGARGVASLAFHMGGHGVAGEFWKPPGEVVRIAGGESIRPGRQPRQHWVERGRGRGSMIYVPLQAASGRCRPTSCRGEEVILDVAAGGADRWSGSMLAGLVKPPTLVLALSIAAGASCSRGAAPEPCATACRDGGPRAHRSLRRGASLPGLHPRWGSSGARGYHSGVLASHQLSSPCPPATATASRSSIPGSAA